MVSGARRTNGAAEENAMTPCDARISTDASVATAGDEGRRADTPISIS